ncbi:MAG: hypothetical protein JNL80_11175 [Phycisphaerae bacterium]|jgi:hypothetical protein|nr:hypothetical protein [Phycisphaerae bacterium]
MAHSYRIVQRLLLILAMLVTSESYAGGPSLCCPADLDRDGVVGGADLAILLGAWSSGAADLTSDGVTDGADLAVLLGGWGACPDPCLKTLVVGSVTLADNTPVDEAVVVTEFGGQGVSGPDGSFTIEVEVGQQTRSLQVTAVASIRGVAYTGSTFVSPVVLDGVTEAGAIVVSAESPCSGEFGWIPEPGLSALNGPVNALTVFNDGKGPALYAAGHFTMAGGVSANRIAKWNGSSWSPLGTGSSNGVNAAVWALTVYDDGDGPALYAGGQFSMAGGTTANRVAKWNGSVWTPLGLGAANGVAGSTVFALTPFDDGSGGGSALYVAGGFTTAGGIPANRIARWDGSSWSSLGAGSANGVDNGVSALTVFDDLAGDGPALYVGGAFTNAGGVFAKYIAKWNGTSWSALGAGSTNGTTGTVWALAATADGADGGPALYAGGFFTSAGGATVNNVARWNGSSWSALGTGSAIGLNLWVQALTILDNGLGNIPTLFVGGYFDGAGGASANHIAQWNGNVWSPLGAGSTNGVNLVVRALTVFNDGTGPALYASGDFTIAGGLSTPFIAKWGCTLSNNDARKAP